MAFAKPPKTKITGTNLSKSTWTPMNNSDANKEFDKWHEKQRRIVIEDIFKSLSEKHLLAVHNELRKKFPEERHDFTKRLPRVLSLYVFSFLDPRSLSRCAQVSWYWKYLTELDCLWKPKCLKFGWYPTYQPSLYEETVWKRHYISTIYQLHYAKPKEDKPKENGENEDLNTARTDNTRLSTARSNASVISTSRRKKAVVAQKNVPIPGPKWEPPPWRGSDPHPTDTFRYNYFDNKSAPKYKARNHARPKSASGASILVAKKSDQSPSKSSARPGSASSARKASATQSLDPQSLRSNGSVNGDHIPVATSRNMMSTSVLNFSHTASLMKPDELGHTLRSSSHFTEPQLHGSPLKSMGMPDVSPNAKDATVRPKPVTSFSLDKSQTRKEKQDDKKADGDIPKIKKPIASVSDYKIKEPAPTSGKVSPLKGSPWNTQDIESEDSDF